ncbi:alpha-1A adrenergic receptor-like [Hydractinia symbiolongicarpus]|uniref:alpha-1A adrenergic receptor-like n=1 Tax=Hydractinia symbiolongicarpus TaxID=13093 RepID=UPI00254D503B|nr:alpha-1A adrenergic receptor-like [Hydractinia symbiolongicarpus]
MFLRCFRGFIIMTITTVLTSLSTLSSSSTSSSSSSSYFSSSSSPTISTTNSLNLTKVGHDLNKTFALTISIYFIILIIVGTITNVLLITTIVCRRKLHTTANALIVNLAISDLLVTVVVVSSDAEFILLGHYPHGQLYCGIKEVTLMFWLPLSVYNLLLLTIERFVTIKWPYQKSRIFSRINTVILVSFVWCYTILVGIFPILDGTDVVYAQQGFCWMRITSNYIVYQLCANFLPPLLCIIVLNILLFKVASKHEIAIRSQTQTSQQYPSLIFFLADIKATKTVMMLVGTFSFCWLTFIILVTTNFLCNICHPRELTWTGNAINYLSIATNPLLYGLKNKALRTEFLRFIRDVCIKLAVNKNNRSSWNASLTLHKSLFVSHTNTRSQRASTYAESETFI